MVDKPDGVHKLLWDYSIDLIGPGARARDQVEACHRAGIPIRVLSMAARLQRAAEEMDAAREEVPAECRLTFDAEDLPLQWFYRTAKTRANFYASCRLRDALAALAKQPALDEAARRAAAWPTLRQPARPNRDRSWQRRRHQQSGSSAGTAKVRNGCETFSRPSGTSLRLLLR